MTTSAEIAQRVSGKTVTSSFLQTLRTRPDAVALRWRDGETWREWTWSGYADRACKVAAGLRSLGLDRGGRLVMIMRNRPDFHVVDLAALLCGATPISIYNSRPANKCNTWQNTRSRRLRLSKTSHSSNVS